jgi:hypothetical protein
VGKLTQSVSRALQGYGFVNHLPIRMQSSARSNPHTFAKPQINQSHPKLEKRLPTCSYYAMFTSF